MLCRVTCGIRALFDSRQVELCGQAIAILSNFSHKPPTPLKPLPAPSERAAALASGDQPSGESAVVESAHTAFLRQNRDPSPSPEAQDSAEHATKESDVSVVDEDITASASSIAESSAGMLRGHLNPRVIYVR